MNRALERVTTPFVVRMDDDQLLTPFTRIEKQLNFLKEHEEVDLVGILLNHLPKTPNMFVARTDKIKEIGYDDNIRMIDHNEFFYRAAGNIVSVLDKTAFVLHFRNWFDTHYNQYRSDYQGDVVYIRGKMRNYSYSSKRLVEDKREMQE